MKKIYNNNSLHSNYQKIRVLRIVSRFNIGGPSIHVKNLTEGLENNRYITKLVTGSISPNEGDMSYIAKFNNHVRIVVPELQREIDPYKDLLAFLKTLKIMHKFQPDIVHSHTSKAGTISRASAIVCNIFRKQKIVTVHTFHGNVLDGYFSRSKSLIILIIERVLAKFTNQIIAISKTQKWELSNSYKIAKPDKIGTIKLGFDLVPFLYCSNQKVFLRKKFGLSDDSLLIGIVGRMAPIKNHKMFLDAGKLLIDQAKNKNIKFILVGDGEERPVLEKYAYDIGIGQHVIFYGWERNIPMIYADIDILALTSLNEGTPVSVIEAMAASVPVVTTGVGGIKDLLGTFENGQPEKAAFKICERGILCPKDDPLTFSEALRYMIESGYLLEKQRFSRASDYVVENYSVKRLVSDMENLYEKLLTANRN